MDKEEYRIKLNQMNHYVDQKKYKEAMDVVDSIDWRRVKNVRNLCVVGEIYAANKRYEESREIFLLAYHRAPIGKNILYRLIEVSLKMKDVQEAEEFFEEFQEVAPNDSNQYILRYKISKAENASLEEQIRILEDYKEREFTERWSYELAKLYYQNGDTKKCLELCNDIILWFNEGRYVLKAMDLKNRMGQLTGAEKEKYEKQFVPNLTTVEQMEQGGADIQAVKEEAAEEDTPVIENVCMDERDINNAESLQEKISKSIRDIFNGSRKESEEEFAEEEQDIQEEVQDEMIKDSSSEEEDHNVPELEPEEVSVDAEASDSEPAEEIMQEQPEEAAEEVSKLENEEELDDNIKELQKFEIPDSMKDVGLAENVYADIPKAPDIVLPDMDTEEEDKEFNLEDMILSAATAQGIEIPKDTVAEQPKEQEMEEFQDEDYMSEEDLQSAEDEFLNGPAGRKPDPEIEEDEIRGEDSYEDDELNDDEFYEYSDDDDGDFYEDETDGEEEDSFYEEDEEDEEDDELYEDDDDDFYGEEEDEFYEEEEELPVVSRKPIPEKKTAKVRKPDPERRTVFREEAAPARKEMPKKKKRRISEEEELERFVDSIRPQEAMDIIPREKKLTDSEKKLFTYFAKVPGLREQLVDALCDVQTAAADKTSRTGNIIVMGGRETGKTRLISGLIPAICKELNLEAAKVAYVFADQINGKNIAAIVKKMAGGFLVIENANQLKKETVNQLSKAMEFRTDGMIVIMEDEKIGMRKLMARFPKFASKFTSMINIPVFTNDELVNFAMIYTRERGYTIDQKAMVALYNLISTNQKDDEPMNVGAVKDIIDSAIARSTGGIRKLSRNISKKRTDVDGYVVLYEKDFN